MREIVLSGIRPTGKLHLGNYFGALKDFVRLQNEGKRCFFFVADWHSLTTLEHHEKIRENTSEIIKTYLSIGLNPNKCTIFVQSDVPEIAEIAILLSMFQPANELSVLPTYKDVIVKHPENNNAGLLYYPILMAADILAHKATLVPVGRDQEIHVRVAKNIVRIINNRFGNILPIPQIFEKETIVVPGLDGSGKMAKSKEKKNTTIDLIDSKKAIKEKLSRALTDPQRKKRNDPGNPFNCNLFKLHELTSDEDIVKNIQQGCHSAEIGCVDCKRCLTDSIWNLLTPIQERRKNITDKDIQNTREKGAREARESAQKTLKILKTKMGLSS